MNLIEFKELKDYQEVWNLQKELVAKRAQNEIPDTLILVEHKSIYTTGRAEKSVETIKVPRRGEISVLEVERGGRMTFHGPGQLVGYPIFHLKHHDLRRFLRDMERLLITIVSEQALLSVKPGPETLFLEPGQLQTGVWVSDRKLASIGIAIKNWVSYHGFALNLSTDLKYFEAIEPCGFSGSVMTSLENELLSQKSKKSIDLTSLNHQIRNCLIEGFSRLSDDMQKSEVLNPSV